MRPEVVVALALGCAATLEDLARRQVSNWIPLAALAGGLAVQGWERGWSGIGSALLGAVAGFLVFLVFYLFGGMGGGDVKLMAGFGAVIGIGRLLEAALWTAALGGLLALGVIAWQAGRRRWRQWRGMSDVEAGQFIPYAPAITLGVWLSLIPNG